MPDKKIRLAFCTHGLGDVVHAATAMRLYVNRGYDVQIQVEPNKRWVWEAAGIPIYEGPDKLPVHPYVYPDFGSFFDLGTPDHLYSKIAHFFEFAELPKLGTKEEVWQAVCNQRIDATSFIPPDAHAEAEQFLKGLPHPIFALHSRGTSWAEQKSIPHGVAFELILKLIEESGGSVIVLDYDHRAPTVSDHPRVKNLKPDWGHIGCDRFCALMQRIDLFIGIDSGPFHLAGMVPGAKALGVFRKIPPVRCCLPNPNATYLVPAKDHEHWTARGPEWAFAEYQDDDVTADDIADLAIKLVFYKEGNVMELSEKSVVGRYLYKRIGYDERLIELLPGGQIGIGAAGCERIWKIEASPTGPVVNIYGDQNRHTIRLRPADSGALTGAWLVHERMPIELIPRNRETQSVGLLDLSDGQLKRWSPEQAASLFSSYHPAWNLPVGSRGNGAAWLIDPAIERSDLDASSQDHEDWMYSHIEVPPGSVCLDLASFVGTVAVWWAKRGAKVIGVEPIPMIRDTLYRNLILNQVTDSVTVIPKAFGDRIGHASMSIESYNSMIRDGGECKVDLTTVDAELLPTLKRLDMIKLDVEGAECEVIAGAAQTIRKFRPTLIIEVHSHLPGREQNGTILARQLDDLGYTIRRIWTNTEEYYYLKATPRT